MCGCASTARSKRACNRSIALVLGGLVEGVWPPETRGDPWLSRPMRHELGLDLPERRIGLSAHDFAQALGAPEVILTRAAKLGGAPTVASRFVQRLAAVAGEARWKAALERGARYAALARKLDETIKAKSGDAARAAAAARGAATTAQRHRDRGLAARPLHDLRQARAQLQPLDAIDTPPGAADRGTLIHDSIGEFAKTFPQSMPDDPVAALTDIGARHFQPLADFPEARAFWWPRFLRIAEWLARFEIARRAKLSRFDAEIGGSIAIPFGNEEFKLTVRADRIECLKDGALRRARLQDRRAAERQAGAHRSVAAAHARGRDPAPGRLQGHSRRAHRWRSSSMCGCAAAPWPAKSCRSSSRTARPTSTPTTRCRSSPSCVAKFADPATPVLLAAASDVDARTTAPTTISPACRSGR